jgi:S-DNA-T family DNA segregation ATPase FtsK/SpoIIIE
VAAKDSLLPIDDEMDGRDARDSGAPTDPPKKRRKKPALRLETSNDDVPVPVMVGSSPPRLVVSEPLALDDDDDDERDDEEDEGATGTPRTAKRARRRPRVEHVSTPPTAAEDTSPEQPSKKRASSAKKKSGATKRGTGAGDRWAHLPLEIAGVVVFALGVLVMLSLLSYSSMDTAAGRTAPVKNWIGPGGATLADLLTLVLGLAAFLAPLGLFVASVMCFRPVSQPRHAALRIAGAIAGVLGSMTLLHLAFRGSTALPFPAGGLIGAVVADAGSRTLAPLGTGVVALAIAFVGFLLALDRPVGPTTRGLAEKLVELFHATREKIEIWREERRLLIEEEERLRAELEEEQAKEREKEDRAAEKAAAKLAKKRKSGDVDDDDEANLDGDDDGALGDDASKRKARIKDEAEKRAKKRLLDGKLISVAPVGESVPPVEIGKAPAPIIGVASKDAPATVVDMPPVSDPPWALGDVGPAGEPVVDGKKINLDKVLAGAATDDEVSGDDAEDGTLRIIERKVVDAKAVVEAAEAVVPVVEKQAFALPPLNLLDYDAPAPEPLDEAKMRMQADKLIAKFKDFGIDGRIREIRPGPVVTTYELVPAPGIKVSKIAALADDIAMAMEAIHVRIVAPIPGKGAVGIEIPNEKRETVYMKEIIADPAFAKRTEKLMMALGKDIEGRSYYANLAEMPHVLIAGTTGSGKSVSVNAMICSILYRATPEDVRFLMIDPKMLELSIYEGIPHLLLPPIIDSKKAAVALKWAVQEMERRYQLMSELGVRDMAGFNARVAGALDGTDLEAKKTLTEALKGKPIEKFPFIVIVVDEYADLLAVAGKDVEGYIMRLAQKARAAGLHVMLATQRPSVDVITGVIKANFPVRMGFRLASNHDSKTIINRPGAEKLLGRGDMLFMPPGTSNVSRVHGAFISEKELHRVVDFLKNQGTPSYDMSILTVSEDDEGGGEGGGDVLDEPKDTRYDEAVAVVARTKKCSTSWLQRSMNLGYQRAARIVDRMEREGLVGPAQNAKGDREIFVKPDALPPPS